VLSITLHLEAINVRMYSIGNNKSNHSMLFKENGDTIPKCLETGVYVE